ncbi:NOL1/NOP2/sun family putative RNA methylase [Aliikangiella marina]|uniref:NOL1/NOP2/sun family putative RNA methylase n=1 Tax=Aliikangiella marina TaxID=1712262 RepID=A0A545TCF6_9GAMM|nr:NOL1/NOP2/sun family putative RNA methylase [Aliikangiella marina]TQV74895.1 NOL1/NOP2/sun family putative RNA methylase [Aliikangiella marina]
MSDLLKLASGGKINPAYLAHAKQTFLSQADEKAFLDACGRGLRKSVRVNTLKYSVEEFRELAARHQWQLTAIPWCKEGFWVDESSLSENTALGNTPEHVQGLFYIQEASSMLPSVALLGDNKLAAPLVLDMAAAPGSKTTQLAAMLNNQGLVVANELSASRLKSLHNNLVRCGIFNAAMSHHDGRKFADFVPGLFDYILLDAPCGGEGTVRKDIHALENWSLAKVKEIGELQKALILSAYQSLKPGGRLVYSTCTLSVEENQAIVEFLRANTDAKVINLKHLFEGAERSLIAEGYLHVLPHLYDSEGFFVACIGKPAESQPSESPLAQFKSPFEKLTKKEKLRLREYYQAQFGIDIEPDGFQLLKRQKEVWIFPQAIGEVNAYMKVNRAGMKIAEVYPNKIRSTHEFAYCFGQAATDQIVELTKPDFVEFVKGQSLHLDNCDCRDGEVLMFYQKKVIGIAQKQKNKIKNGYPRELVKDNYQG